MNETMQNAFDNGIDLWKRISHYLHTTFDHIENSPQNTIPRNLGTKSRTHKTKII